MTQDKSPDKTIINIENIGDFVLDIEVPATLQSGQNITLCVKKMDLSDVLGHAWKEIRTRQVLGTFARKNETIPEGYKHTVRAAGVRGTGVTLEAKKSGTAKWFKQSADEAERLKFLVEELGLEERRAKEILRAGEKGV